MPPAAHQVQRATVRSWSVVSRGTTVLELLVVVAVIGVLVSLILPAVIRVRESTRVMVCSNHMRQIGIAVHHYHDRRGQLPASWRVSHDDHSFAFGWASELLTDIEQSELDQEFLRTGSPKKMLTAESAHAAMLPLFICPSDITEPTFPLYAAVEDDDEIEHTVGAGTSDSSAPEVLCVLPTSNYVCVYGTVEADEFDEYDGSAVGTFGDGSVIDDKRVTFADLRRGLSNTIVVGERTMAKLPSSWAGFDMRSEDHGCRVAGSAMLHPNCDECDECEFDSRHAAGSNFLWADGRVTTVSQFVDPIVYRNSAKRNQQGEGE